MKDHILKSIIEYILNFTIFDVFIKFDSIQVS